MRKAILITIDGWGTNLIGAYGNALCRTPALDRFAAKSIVFDRHFASDTSLEAIMQSIVTGYHPCESIQEPNFDLPELLQMFGKQSVLMTDDPVVAAYPWAQNFNELFCFDPQSNHPSDIDSEADDWTTTKLANFVEASLGELAQFQNATDGLPDWTWLHLSGLTRHWDAPFEYRLELCDGEDDPEPPHGVQPAEFEVDSKTDPDKIFGTSCGAAAQGILIDQLLALIDGFLDEMVDRKDCLVVVTGLRGYPLGEHHSVGFATENLFVEYVHTPLMIQPGQLDIGRRMNAIVQPMSLWATIAEWLIVEPDKRNNIGPWLAQRRLSRNLIAEPFDGFSKDQLTRSVSLISGPTSACMHVPRWSAIWPSLDQSSRDRSSLEGKVESCQLFLSPDDRWQQNDVQMRALEIVDAMETTRAAWLAWLATSSPSTAAPPTLPECLLHQP